MTELIKKQKSFFNAGSTKNLESRKQTLRTLKELIQTNEERFYAAIDLDFKKSRIETFATELSFIYSEIDEAIRHLSRWSRPKKVSSPLATFPAKSFIVPEPYGNVLVLGAWNYPYQLSLVPAVSALAAGNTVILKPSEISAHTSALMAKLINSQFDPQLFAVVEGGIEASTELLTLPFDKIFFTGSTAVGKIVAIAAAKNLTPVTLELGGKSPCFVFADADLKVSARRIVWGKFLNAGQTCIAPDYLLIEDSIYETFLGELKEQLRLQLGEQPRLGDSYVQIINAKNFDRLRKLLPKDQIYCGGETDEASRYIQPTILKDVKFSDAIMEEEIFGPILPTLRFSNWKDLKPELLGRSKPLAFYAFTKNSDLQNQLIEDFSFGGGTFNDVVMHISNSQLPFGGVGGSGQGSYHGEYGFKTFSHYKSILKKPFWGDIPVKYPPYTDLKKKLIRLVMGG